MNKTRGFTLIELLVVIAIIGILAGIVVPNVTGFIARGQLARAVSEIRNAETALTAALADTGRSRFRDWLSAAGIAQVNNLSPDVGNPFTLAQFRTAQEFYNDFFYELLRQGRNSEFLRPILKPEIRRKLANSYMDLGNDPWGNQYRFWMGPSLTPPVAFRSYRIPEGADPEDENYQSYIYNAARRQIENDRIPGAPPFDDQFGFPAPRDLPIYIMSMGFNQTLDSTLYAFSFYNPVLPEFVGGGDDVNNWDHEAGWENAPR